MGVVPLALEVQHCVDHVLEDLGASKAAVLGHVADEHGRQVLPLGGEQQLRGRLANLPHRARRRRQLGRVHGLDRVDDEQGRPEALDFLEDALGAGLGQQVQRRVADAEPFATPLDLVFGLLARAVQDRAGPLRELRRRLQQQRALADAGFTAEQDQTAGHQPAAEHAVELADARGDALGLHHVDVGVESRLPARRAEARARSSGRHRRRGRFLGEGVPRAAVGASPQPFGRLRAAVGTRKDRLGSAHLAI